MMDDLTQQMIDLYLSGFTLEKVGALVSRSASCVGRRLREEGIPRRPRGRPRIYFLNDSYFEVINTEPKAYWLGFLAADGGLSPTNLQIILNLECGDRDHVIKLREALGATYPIYECKRIVKERVYLSSRLAMTSGGMFDDLVAHGVPPAKSLTLKPPLGVPNHLISHWIRGYFDGDGCVDSFRNRKGGSLYGRVRTTSTREVLRFIRVKLGGVGHIYPKNSKTFSFNIYVQKDIEKFRNYIYKGATVYLERKRAIFESELGEINV